MKKAFILCALLCLNACVYAGEVNVLPGRGTWFDQFNSYRIVHKDNVAKLVKTENINEKSFKVNELRTAFKGYSVLSDKTFSRRTYVTEKVRAVGNVRLNNVSAPYEFKNNQTFVPSMFVTIDGTEYGLLPTHLEDFVVLYDVKNGKLYPNTGMIKNGRLVLLRHTFAVDNPDFYFEPVFITKTEQSKPVKGFDIKYDGVRLQRLWLIYYDYADGHTGAFQEFSFPAKSSIIEINDIKLRILSADDQRLDYMILD